MKSGTILIVILSIIICYPCDGNVPHSFPNQYSKVSYVVDTSVTQINKKYHKKINLANLLYKKLAFTKAIKVYLDIPNLGLTEKLNLADSYRRTDNTKEAEVWYRQIINLTDDPIIHLRYAQVLQSNGKEEEASEYFKYYFDRQSDNSIWENEIRGLSERINNLQRFNNAVINLENQEKVNTSGLDYSPAFYKNGVIFVSTRDDQKSINSHKDPWIDENFMSLFLAKKDIENDLGEVEEFSYDLKTKYHEGPVCFSNNGEIIYFTRSNYQKGERINDSNGVMKLQIFSSIWNGIKWETPRQLSFNLIDYEECHPSISPDGMRLYFSSDRPGGYGGMDLYVTENRYGVWTNPQNLGPNINTPGNEIFPFIHNSGILFYSSNGWDGLGGLDILFSQKNSKGQWQHSKNIGEPFNSKKDDFGIIIDEHGEYGYLSSSRAGGKGRDDIYSFALKRPDNTEISPLTQLTSDVLQHYSLVDFEFLPSIVMNPIVFSSIAKDIRLPDKLKAINELKYEDDFFEKLSSGEAFVLDNFYYDFNSFSLTEKAKLELDKIVRLLKYYPRMIVEIGSHTDSRGSEEYNLKLSQKRAFAAVQYIINRGISQNNVKAKGYGENIPRNRCKNGVDCSDEEHHFNRRTELRIIKF